MSFSYAEVEESKFRSLLSCGVPDNCSYEHYKVKQKELSLKQLGKMFVWRDIPKKTASISFQHFPSPWISTIPKTEPSKYLVRSKYPYLIFYAVHGRTLSFSESHRLVKEDIFLLQGRRIKFRGDCSHPAGFHLLLGVPPRESV